MWHIIPFIQLLLRGNLIFYAHLSILDSEADMVIPSMGELEHTLPTIVPSECPNK